MGIEAHCSPLRGRGNACARERTYVWSVDTYACARPSRSFPPPPKGKHGPRHPRVTCTCLQVRTWVEGETTSAVL